MYHGWTSPHRGPSNSSAWTVLYIFLPGYTVLITFHEPMCFKLCNATARVRVPGDRTKIVTESMLVWASTFVALPARYICAHAHVHYMPHRHRNSLERGMLHWPDWMLQDPSTGSSAPWRRVGQHCSCWSFGRVGLCWACGTWWGPNPTCERLGADKQRRIRSTLGTGRGQITGSRCGHVSVQTCEAGAVAGGAGQRCV